MSPKPPNIILCMCDQLRAHELGCYGNAAIRTPHLDALAAGGLRFEHAVTNNPVCQPARSSLLSGRYSRSCMTRMSNYACDPPRRSRQDLLDPTLPELLRDAGYHTALIGKWHIDPDPALVGFDAACHTTIIHRYRDTLYFEDGAPAGRVDWGPAHEMEKVDAFLASRAADAAQPFFLYYAPGLPHMPLAPHELTDACADRYSRDEIPLRPNVYDANGQPAYDEKWFTIYTIWDYFYRIWNGCIDCAPGLGYPTDLAARPTDRLPAGFDLRELTRLYYGAVSVVDDQVGRLLATLERHGMLENTLIVFLSDHGDNLGSHQLFNKNQLIEESIRIPMLWHWPAAIAPGVAPAQVAQIVDIAPTLLAQAGITPPAHMQGRDLSPVLQAPAATLADSAGFIETGPTRIGIRTPTHSYGVDLDSHLPAAAARPWGLYDLQADPYQMQDLSADPCHAGLRAELESRLLAWHRDTPFLAKP